MEKTKKKRMKRYITWVLLAAMVAGLAAMPLLAAREEEASGPRASILSATARERSVDITVRGGGILEAGDTESVTLPQGVQITEFLVENDTWIAEGTPVARVDRISVMNTILQVRASMDTIQKQLSQAMDDTIDPVIRAAAGGRVKKVYALPGDSVQDVMLRHGALAVLSLDGLMAVRLEHSILLGAGDPVIVLRENGEELPGRVESCLNGILVVTVADNGYTEGETVQILEEDGTPIGSGELYIHNAWKATGYSGTVQAVHIRENQNVTEGASLFALTDRSFTGKRDTLAAKYQEYADMLQRLLQLYESEVVTAPMDGVVYGVDSESPILLSATQTHRNAEPLAVSDGSGWQVHLLSGQLDKECTGKESLEGTCTAWDHVKGCYFYCTGTASCTAKPLDHRITCLSLCISAGEEGKCLALNHKAGCIETCECRTETGQCPAVVHKAGCVESCTPTDGTADCPAGVHKPECLEACDKTETCPATDHHYPQCLTLCTGDEACSALHHTEGCYMTNLSYQAYAAMVRQVGITELVVAADTQTRYQVKTGRTGWVLVEPAAVLQELLISEQTLAVADPSQYKAGDIILIWTGYEGDQQVKNGVAVYSKATGGTPGTFPGGMDFSGILGGMYGGFGGFSGFSGGSAQGSEDTLYDLTEQVLLTLADHSTMTLTVTLDEQDISGIYPGQPAAVKITALKGEVFAAQISQVGAEGTNNGGSSKFTAELTLSGREDMLPGMHATAEIVCGTAEDILTIPVAALVDEPGDTMVYTALDPETGEPAGMVPVTTGIADGQYVQILTGLNAGDTVYYSYYEAPELDHTAKPDSTFG